MKTKQWLIITLSAGIVTLAAGAATTDTNAASAAAAAKASTPEPAVSKQDNVNVRGQAAINSEVVTRLKKGQAVTILEEITLKKPGEDEPAKWCRIALPTNVAVWVFADYVDVETHSVKPRRLNLRSGPGENYSVLGRIEKGTKVTVLTNKESWLKIEAPADAYGFVAAHLLEKPVAPPVIVAVKPPPPTVVAVVTNPPPVEIKTTVLPDAKSNDVVAAETAIIAAAKTNTTDVAVTPATNVVVAVPTPTNTPVIVSAMPTNVVTDATNVVTTPPEPAPKRIVMREGMLKGMTSIQAPTYFELRSLDNNKVINYVWTTSTNLPLKQFKGMKVVVTGEELLDERWPNTPVLTVDSIDRAP